MQKPSTPIHFHTLVLIFLVIGVLGYLAGCQDINGLGLQTPTPTVQPATATATRTPTPTVTPTPTAEIEVVKPEDLKGLKVTLWHTWTGDLEDQLNTLESTFNATNTWGIWTDVQSVADQGDLSASVRTGLANKSSPDIVIASSEEAAAWNTPDPVVVDLSPFLQSPLWGLTVEDITDFPPVYWNQDLIGTERLGVPALRDASILFYNQTWAGELGFTATPQNLADFQKQICAAAQANLNDEDYENDGLGGWIVDDDPVTVSAWIQAIGGRDAFTATDGEVAVNMQAVETAFTTLREWYDQGCAWQARLDEPYGYFANRRALVFSGSLADIPVLVHYLEKAENQDKWVVLPYPSSEDQPVLLVSGPSYHVLSSNPAQEVAAWLFVRFLLSSENQAALASAGGLLPVRETALAQMQAGGGFPDAWNETVGWLSAASSTPGQADWQVKHQVIADAYRQLFNADVTKDSIPTMMDLIQATIQDILEHE